MLGFICGNVVSVEENTILVQSGDIGFEVSVSDFTLQKCVEGQKTQLFTYLQVREDGLTLYGFADKYEKNLFLKLISVSGIGCKMALSVLSNCSVTDLLSAICTGNVKLLSSVKGIGKKTAERIVLELREKVVPVGDTVEIARQEYSFNSEENDAVALLISMGIAKNDAENRVKHAVEAGLYEAGDIIKFALKNAR